MPHTIQKGVRCLSCIPGRTLLLSLAFLAFVFQTSQAEAQEGAQSGGPPLPSACAPEVAQFCADKTNPRETARCLMGRFAELAPQCKQEIERYLQFLAGAEERGGGALSSFGGPNAMGPPIAIVTYDGRYMPGQQSPSLAEHRFFLSLPVHKGEASTVATSLAAGQVRLGESILLDSGKTVPQLLHRYEIGGQYFSRLPEKRMFSVRASAGYSGDKPSEANKDASYSVNMSYGRPASGNGYWMFMAFMTNNSPFLNYVPIPGVIYLHRTPTFTGMFGLPILSMQWTPVNPWAFSLSVFITNVQSEISYGHRNRPQGFLHYGFTQQSYIPHDRGKERDRLTLREQKLSTGLRTPIYRKTQLEIQVGHSFDRSIYIGEGIMNKDRGAADIKPDLFGTLGIKMAL